MRSRQTAASVIYILNEVPIAGGWALRDSLWSNSTTRRSKRALVFHSKVILHHRASVLSCALLASISLLPLSPLLLSTRGLGDPILFDTLLKIHTLAALTLVPLLPLTLVPRYLQESKSSIRTSCQHGTPEPTTKAMVTS